MLCLNGPSNELNKEQNQKGASELSTLNWLELLIGPSLENQFASKSSWPKCLDLELVKKSGYCPITNRRYDELITFGELIVETDWVGTFPITLFRLTKVAKKRLPDKLTLWVFEDGPVEALTLKTLGELKAMHHQFEIQKLANSWMIKSIIKSLKNPFLQAVTNAYFNDIRLPAEFRGAW